MRRFTRTTILALFVALVLGSGNMGYADQIFWLSPIRATLEPGLPMIKGSPITLNLSYEIDTAWSDRIANTDSYLVTFIDPRDYSDTLSQATYQATHSDDFSRTAMIHVIFPEADTCLLHLKIISGTCWTRYKYFFVASGDEYELRPDFFMPPSGQFQTWTTRREISRRDPDRDTLTSEHLQTEYEVIFDLRDSLHFEIAAKILGQIPDSCIYNNRRGLYKITTTLENLIEFGDQDFEFEFTTPPPWDPKYKDPSDSTPDTQPTPDSDDNQGNLPPPQQISSINT